MVRYALLNYNTSDVLLEVDEVYMTDNSEQPQEKPSNFTRLQALLFLIGSLVVGAVVMVLLTWWVVGSAPRAIAISIDAGVTVEEYITLPDDDSYPAAVALGDDGTLYTGSYSSGVIWSITAEGFISEVDNTRDQIGSVTGLDVASDGTLYILDRIEALDAKGAIIWRYADGNLTSLVEIPYDDTVGVTIPDDIAVDRDGLIYITDREQASVWRYGADGSNQGVWWQPPASPVTEKSAPTGLAYDPTENAILITDGEQDAIYRVSTASADLAEARDNTEMLYVDTQGNGYGFDGIDVSPFRGIYVALLGWNRVARLDGKQLVMLAQEFRGASDVVYDTEKDALYVTNWNQFSLGFGTSPQLPFALDILDLSPDNIAE